MGKTRRRNPYAQDLGSPKYRQRRIKDKRKKKLEELEQNEATEDSGHRSDQIQGSDGG